MRILLLFLLSLILNLTLAQGDSIFVSHNSKRINDTILLSIQGNFDYTYYSTDGSYPKYKEYKEAIKITKTTFILFRCVYKEQKKDTIIGRSFIFEKESKFPTLSIAIENENLWDAQKGIYTRGSGASFSDSTGHWENCNFQKKWEKPIHVIYIDSTNTSVINQPCGIRIFGESTRRQPDKSMKIVARKKYGIKRFYHLFLRIKT